MILDPSFLGNTLIFLMMASVQLGLLSDLFEDENSNDTNDDSDPSPLYDASLYTQAIDGTAADDFIISTSEEINQAYFLGAGDDSLNATTGNDYVEGGIGDDVLITFEGDDIALGGAGNDNIFGGRGDDQLFGDAGNDLLEGSLGTDILSGGDGNDILSGGRDDDRLVGGAGDDIMTGDRFDQIGGIARGVDTLSGGDGNDAIWLVGNDTGTGGAGEDLFRILDSGDAGALVSITDFDPDADRIEVVYEGSGSDPAPSLTVNDIPDTEDAHISLDGVEIAVVSGGAGLAVADIELTNFNPTEGGVPA